MQHDPVADGTDQRPDAVTHARNLIWILAGFLAVGFVANVVTLVLGNDVHVVVAVGALTSIGLLLAMAVAAAIGIGAGRPWAVPVLAGTLVLQIVVFVAWLMSGSVGSGSILFVLPAVALGKLRRPESQAYFSRTASILADQS